VKAFIMSLSALLLVSSIQQARAEEPAVPRDISVPATVAASSVKNPAITTTGTLTILQAVAFSALATSTAKAAISYSWDFGDGSPADTRQNPSHIFTAPGNYPVTLTIREEGNPDAAVKTLTAVITDAIKSARLLASFKFAKSQGDQLKLSGTLRVPVSTSSSQPAVSIDIGGIAFDFKLDERGGATIKSVNRTVSGVAQAAGVDGSFKIFVKKRPSGTAYEDAKFYLNLKHGALLPALADEFIFNRDADRESLRVSAKIVINNAVYQSTFSPVFSAKKDLAGNLR
jgi:PKD repeat protein